MNKNLSLMLVLVVLFTFLPLDSVLAANGNVKSSSPINVSEPNNPKLDKMILIDTKMVTIKDDEGNPVNVILEEYGESISSINNISPNNLFPEYPLGYKKYWVMKITNAALGSPFGASAIMSSAMKTKLTNTVIRLIGQEIAGALAPPLGFAARIAATTALINEICGNTGFRLTVNGTYTRTFWNSQGYYLYGWQINDLDMVTY